MKFTLFWLTGRSEIVTGNSIANAFNNAGYSQGALHALDFYTSGDQTNSYQWNSKTRNWESKQN